MANLVQLVRSAGDVDEVGEALKRIVDFVCDRCGETTGGGKLFSAHERALGHAPFGDVAEDKNDADHFAGAVADRRAAVVDADLIAVLRDQEGVVGEADDGAEAAHLVDGIFNERTRVFVEDGKDLVQGTRREPRFPASR